MEYAGVEEPKSSCRYRVDVAPMTQYSFQNGNIDVYIIKAKQKIQANLESKMDYDCLIISGQNSYNSLEKDIDTNTKLITD